MVYRTADLRSQLDNLLLEDLQPLEKINKLIELYLNRINSNKGIYRILHFEFSSKKRDENLKVYIPYIKEQISNMNSQPKGNPLVPMEPIDGNKFVINKIKFINHRWIIGDFSNGQMWGEVLLKYFINEDKTVSFETAQHILYAK